MQLLLYLAANIKIGDVTFRENRYRQIAAGGPLPDERDQANMLLPVIGQHTLTADGYAQSREGSNAK